MAKTIIKILRYVRSRIWGVERTWKTMKDKNSNNSEILSFLINILVSVITTTVVYFLLSK